MRLTKKHLERLAMALIMAFPVSYLFFTQIFVLAGAHGKEVLADDFISSIVTIETTSFEDGNIGTTTGLDSYADNTIRSIDYIDILTPRFEVNASFNNVRSLTTYFYDDNFVYLGYSTTRIFPPDTSLSIEPNYISGASKIRMVYSGETRPSIYSCFIDFKITSNYRNSLFGNMFGESNFLTEWGEDVLSENPHGFAPFASMIKYLDTNMLHLGEKNYGLMAYGQLYYMLNVSIFFLIYKTMVFIPNMITRVFNWFGKENENND